MTACRATEFQTDRRLNHRLIGKQRRPLQSRRGECGSSRRSAPARTAAGGSLKRDLESTTRPSRLGVEAGGGLVGALAVDERGSLNDCGQRLRPPILRRLTPVRAAPCRSLAVFRRQGLDAFRRAVRRLRARPRPPGFRPGKPPD